MGEWAKQLLSLLNIQLIIQEANQLFISHLNGVGGEAMPLGRAVHSLFGCCNREELWLGAKAGPKTIFPRPHGYPSTHIWWPRPILENRDSLGFPAGSSQPWLLLPFKPDTKPLPGQHSPEFRSPWELSTGHGSTDALGTWRCLFLHERKKKALIQTARGNSWRRANS